MTWRQFSSLAVTKLHLPATFLFGDSVFHQENPKSSKVSLHGKFDKIWINLFKIEHSTARAIEWESKPGFYAQLTSEKEIELQNEWILTNLFQPFAECVVRCWLVLHSIRLFQIPNVHCQVGRCGRSIDVLHRRSVHSDVFLFCQPISILPLVPFSDQRSLVQYHQFLERSNRVRIHSWCWFVLQSTVPCDSCAACNGILWPSH